MSFRSSYSGARNSSWNQGNGSAKRAPLKNVENSPRGSGHAYSPRYKEESYAFSPPVHRNPRRPQRSNSLNTRLASNNRPLSNSRPSSNSRPASSSRPTRPASHSRQRPRSASQDFIKLNRDRVAGVSPVPVARRLDYANDSHFSRRGGSRTRDVSDSDGEYREMRRNRRRGGREVNESKTYVSDSDGESRSRLRKLRQASVVRDGRKPARKGYAVSDSDGENRSILQRGSLVHRAGRKPGQSRRESDAETRSILQGGGDSESEGSFVSSAPLKREGICSAARN